MTWPFNRRRNYCCGWRVLRVVCEGPALSLSKGRARPICDSKMRATRRGLYSCPYVEFEPGFRAGPDVRQCGSGRSTGGWPIHPRSLRMSGVVKCKQRDSYCGAGSSVTPHIRTERECVGHLPGAPSKSSINNPTTDTLCLAE